jgi:NAD(P)-dependent dehydrogenase (short-subunit alcohol dehydrogenase family)
VKTFGRIDIVVNNAQGIAPLKPILDKPDEDYAMTLATGFYHSLGHAGRGAHTASGGGSSFISFSSHWGLNGRYASDYNITKSANEALTRSAANERRRGKSIALRPPGTATRTGCMRFNPGMREAIDATIPARHGRAKSTLPAPCSLVSANGRFITGQTFFVDGGAWLAKPPNEHAEDTDIHSGRHQSASA